MKSSVGDRLVKDVHSDVVQLKVEARVISLNELVAQCVGYAASAASLPAKMFVVKLDKVIAAHQTPMAQARVAGLTLVVSEPAVEHYRSGATACTPVPVRPRPRRGGKRRLLA